MNLKSKFGKWLAGAVLGAASVVAHAATYTITIAGVVIPTTVEPVIPNSGYVPPEGVFTALGNCSQIQGFGNSCTDLAAPGGPLQYVGAETNQLRTFADVDQKNLDLGLPPGLGFTYAIIYGYSLPVDQVVFHQFTTTVDINNGQVVSSSGLHQTFDFLAGSTGPGSAGTGTFDYFVDLFRTVTVSGGGLAAPISKTLEQKAILTVGFDEDVLNILDSPILSFNLPDNSVLNIQLMAVEARMGDPGTDVTLTAGAAVPLPSTLALVLLGFAGLARRRMRMH